MKTLIKSKLAFLIILAGLSFSCKKNENITEGNYNDGTDTTTAVQDSIGTVSDSTVMGNKNSNSTNSTNNANSTKSSDDGSNNTNSTNSRNSGTGTSNQGSAGSGASGTTQRGTNSAKTDSTGTTAPKR